ncbi:uncharacterized protein LOC144926884 [Branchiostoma floridae x Branchiostoma belcheri]
MGTEGEEGLNVAEFVRQTKGLSLENKRLKDFISEVSDKVAADRRRISEFENKNRNSSEWVGLSTLKEVNQDLRDRCESCEKKIRENAEKQKENHRFVWETIVACKQSVPDFLRKLGLGQYTTDFTEFGYEEVEDLLDVKIKKGEDIAGDRCWVAFDDERSRLKMARRHLSTLRQGVDKLREKVANIPHRMKSIISSADEAARTSNRFLEACKESIYLAKQLENETTRAAREAEERETRNAAYAISAASLTAGTGALLFGAAVAVTGGLALIPGIAVAAVGAKVLEFGMSVGLITAVHHLVSSSDIFSDRFREKVDELNGQETNMGEKVQKLKTEWLNKIHTCVTKMESTNAEVKYKLVALPSSADEVKSIQSNFDAIFENLETVSPTTNGVKYETDSAFRDRGESNTYCSYCKTSPCLYEF